MAAAIEELQKPFLSQAQIAASKVIMGLDTLLVEDGTYFVIEQDGAMAGCGGWSRRATMYGGDNTPGRNAALLDPKTDAAKIRAMYTHPAFVRRGVAPAHLVWNWFVIFFWVPIFFAHDSAPRQLSLTLLWCCAGPASLSLTSVCSCCTLSRSA